MLKDVTGFIEYCKKKIKNNNRKIKQLRIQATEYETIVDVITRTDISNQILQNYKIKIEQCLNKIDEYMEENQHNHNLIITMKRVNRIMKNK